MSKAEDLLKRMQRTKSGWSADDFETLYAGFGFVNKGGSRHVKYEHSAYPFVALVARHKDLPPGYAATAIKIIEQLKTKLAEEQAKIQNTPEHTRGNVNGQETKI